MATFNLGILISATDRASAVLGGVGSKLGGLEGRLGAGAVAMDEFSSKWENTLAVSRRAGQGMTIAGGAIVGLAGVAVKAASDVQETSSKFDAVFKASTASVRGWAAEQATAWNRSRFDLEGYLATMQDTFVPMGVARDQAAELSKSVTTLAVDLASFNNAAEPDVILDMQSALVGNHETVRKYGVVITEVTLGQQLMAMGIEGGTAAATEQEKMMARLAIITQSTSDAQGDAARTSGSMANQFKGAQAAVKDITVEVGKALLPALQTITPWLTKLAKGVAWLAGTDAGKIATIATVGLGAFMVVAGPLLWFLGTAITLWNGLNAALGRNAVVAAEAAAANLTAGTGAAAGAAAAGGGVAGLLGKVSALGAVAAGWIARIPGLLAGIGPAIAGAFAAIGPAGWVMLAIAALGTAVYFVIKHWDKLGAFFSGIWDRIKGVFSGMWEWMKGAGRKLWDAFVDGLKTAAGPLYKAVSWALEKVSKLLPKSDAEEGPFAQLTAMGAAIPKTLARGVQGGGSRLVGAVNAAGGLAMGGGGLGGGMVVAGSPASGGGRRDVAVTVRYEFPPNAVIIDAGRLVQDPRVRGEVQRVIAEAGNRVAGQYGY